MALGAHARRQEGTEPLQWEATRTAGGQDYLLLKATGGGKGAGHLIANWSPALLRLELDRCLWKDESHVSLKRAWDCLTTYLYFPRLRDEDVFLSTVGEGLLSRDHFAYASSVAADGRYQSLQYGSAGGSIYLDGQSVLVKPEAASKQLVAEAAAQVHAETAAGPPIGMATSTGTPVNNGELIPSLTGSGQGVATGCPQRFHGTVQVDPTRTARDIGQIAQRVIQHLTSLVGTQVQVTLEINATMQDGAPGHVVHTITENCQTLCFTSHGFEVE